MHDPIVQGPRFEAWILPATVLNCAGVEDQKSGGEGLHNGGRGFADSGGGRAARVPAKIREGADWG